MVGKLGVLLRCVEGASELFGKLAAWALFLVGLFIAYEVFMRHVFVAPTIWVDEVSGILQVWAIYCASAYALKHRNMIVIDIAFRDTASVSRKCAETFALSVTLLFSAVAVFYGFELWVDAATKGHTTDTLLAVPKWLTTAPVWVGFTLLFGQATVEVVKVWTVGVADADALDGVH